MKHWLCRTDQHEKCTGKKLKDGIGPVEIVPCSCDCHPPNAPFTLDRSSPIPHVQARVYGDKGKSTLPCIEELRQAAERRALKM